MQQIKILFTGLLLGIVSYTVQGQRILPANDTQKIDTSFGALVKHFDQINFFRKDTLRLPALLVTDDYKIILANSALHLAKQRRILANPFSADKYPLSYSVFYQNNLVSLFDPGHFACYTVDGWQRNLVLEKQLNTKRFERHWLINGQLIGLASGKYWQFAQKDGWKVYLGTVPFKERPKLFEDDNYLIYNQCNGEFGGQIFFFDKQTKKTHWAESTCAVWIRQTSRGYEVLSNLGHMMGSADMQLIRDPRALPQWTGKPTNKTSTSSLSNKPISLFDLTSVQLFGGTERQNQVLYLLHIAERTCLATLSDRTFTVVDPLFNDGLYTHEPVTTIDNGTTLINLDFYGIGRYREVACLFIKNNQVTLLDWHELHSH